MLEWVAIPFSRESSRPRDRTQVSRNADRFFTVWAIREAEYVTDIACVMHAELFILLFGKYGDPTLKLWIQAFYLIWF